MAIDCRTVSTHSFHARNTDFLPLFFCRMSERKKNTFSVLRAAVMGYSSSRFFAVFDKSYKKYTRETSIFLFYRMFCFLFWSVGR